MKHKKANTFTLLTVSIMGIAAFVFVLLFVILMLSTVKSTPAVCSTGLYRNGVCYSCPSGFTVNASYANCCNSTLCADPNNTAITEFGGDAYNATKTTTTAVLLVPQFLQIIIIAIVFLALLALIAFGGMYGYNKLKGK